MFSPAAAAACLACEVTGKSRSRISSKDSADRNASFRLCTLAYTAGVAEPTSRVLSDGFAAPEYARDQMKEPPAGPAAELVRRALWTAASLSGLTCPQLAGTLK